MKKSRTVRAVATDPILHRRLAELQIRLTEAEDTLNAIRNGSVDALVVRTRRGERLFTLKGADEPYRILIEAMNEGAVALKNGIVSYCNSHFARMIGRPMEEVFGVTIFDLVEAPGAFWSALRDLQREKVERVSSEGALRIADRNWMPVLLSASRFYSEGAAAISLVVTDITERKEAERTRQELSHRILNAQEQERQRVARDLHDSVNQLLASAKYRLQNIASPEDARAHRDLEQARRLIEKAIKEVRAISRNLRPSELDDLGLVAALKSLAHDFSERTGITARFAADSGKYPLAPEAKMTVYRIAQEALNNVEKHSGARRVHIALNHSKGEVRLSVADNGNGFNVSKLNGKAGWGLQNMTERARFLGGNFESKSAPGRGTKVCVNIPCRRGGGTALRKPA
jgi:PAS domain S-box-containing protein